MNSNQENQIENVYYIMPVWKLALYCVLTLNLYQFYWFYKSWKFVKYHKPSKIINPVIMSLLSGGPILIVILPFILFQKIYSIIKIQSKIKNIIMAIVLTLVFAVTDSFKYEKNIYMWIAFFTFIPLLIIQHDINIFHQKGVYKEK
ncbi:MAG: hypothetical protein A2Y25_09860 [Candidatus Melainabacteria bacterium GWF2_37_15]|nr:MAG: hypothetical protein A2Y25_09860 [Candidatus Melainabacteria bacterium GWF2_37_15]